MNYKVIQDQNAFGNKLATQEKTRERQFVERKKILSHLDTNFDKYAWLFYFQYIELFDFGIIHLILEQLI